MEHHRNILPAIAPHISTSQCTTNLKAMEAFKKCNIVKREKLVIEKGILEQETSKLVQNSTNQVQIVPNGRKHASTARRRQSRGTGVGGHDGGVDQQEQELLPDLVMDIPSRTQSRKTKQLATANRFGGAPFSKEDFAELEAAFLASKHPRQEHLKTLGDKLGRSSKEISTWFARRRIRATKEYVNNIDMASFVPPPPPPLPEEHELLGAELPPGYIRLSTPCPVPSSPTSPKPESDVSEGAASPTSSSHDARPSVGAVPKIPASPHSQPLMLFLRRLNESAYAVKNSPTIEQQRESVIPERKPNLTLFIRDVVPETLPKVLTETGPNGKSPMSANSCLKTPPPSAWKPVTLLTRDVVPETPPKVLTETGSNGKSPTSANSCFKTPPASAWKTVRPSALDHTTGRQPRVSFRTSPLPKPPPLIRDPIPDTKRTVPEVERTPRRLPVTIVESRPPKLRKVSLDVGPDSAAWGPMMSGRPWSLHSDVTTPTEAPSQPEEPLKKSVEEDSDRRSPPAVIPIDWVYPDFRYTMPLGYPPSDYTPYQHPELCGYDLRYPMLPLPSSWLWYDYVSRPCDTLSVPKYPLWEDGK